MRIVAISSLTQPGPLLSIRPIAIGCILCETDVEVENILIFPSTNKEYHLLVSQVGYDYRAWTSICSSKLFNVIILPSITVYSFMNKVSEVFKYFLTKK